MDTCIVGYSISGKDEMGNNWNARTPVIKMASISSDVAMARWIKGAEIFISL